MSVKPIKPLTNEELKIKAPSLFQDQPYHDVSEKYNFISTIDIIEQLRNQSWFPVNVGESGVRDLSKDGFQQHYVRFQNFSDLINPSSNVVELLLFNSHDRSKSFTISAGIYRYVCSNGLVIADSVFESYKIKHLGERDNDVANAVLKITQVKPKLLSKISKFESITLNQNEKEAFLNSAIPLRFENHLELDNPNELLTPLRAEDEKDDLYTVLNILQENFLSSKISGYNKETNRRFTSKQITSISKDVEINKGLWDIAERIASIKDGSYDRPVIAA
ncbi:DUF932 domain-containing protein [Aliarcobacter butzleri]|uniref:DUF932 domain-containing protein n=1 Tax=Aliarcobacter butzleri TaxID=28197 RepID=UPI00263EBAA7|nr:DUF932 domain-containing protein [Aliarcobacter butzleri]MDN5048596.1 DUF932 domain-containing protein [Aliarcobacter butzleri]MDN5056698.1 DUF932 domain-containing protein [Aliarcobacter butzleri]